MNIIFVGKKNSGKSSLLYQLMKDCKCGGIVCLPVFEDNKKIGTDAINMCSGERKIFSRIKEIANFDGIETKKYRISFEGIKFCINAVEEAIEKCKKCRLIIIDEFGVLERNGKGLNDVIKKALESDKDVVIVVRKELEKEFLEKFPYEFEKIYMG